MKQKGEVLRSESQISYSYATVRLTQSRIDKGLIAIPVSLAGWFPSRNANIEIHLNDSPISQTKRYSSYSSSTKECRIGGVKQWFEENNLTSGDEVVIQLIDKKNLVYRLIPEKKFVTATQLLQASLDNSVSEVDASEKIVRISEWTNVDKDKVALNEYQRLIATSVSVERGRTTRKASRLRESTPPSLRTLLGRLYQGHCQVCDFWFLKKNDEPYFEVHHLDAGGAHHPKNLVVVCGNCHNQFEHADVVSEFNEDQWLIGVCFNKTPYQVNQIVLTGKMPSFSKELFI
jgi:hypothetical protein